MRVLRSKRSLFALAAIAFAYPAVCSTFGATPTSTQVIVEADDVDLAKLELGGKIVVTSSGQRLAAAHAIDGDYRTLFQFAKDDPRPTLIVKLTDNKPVHRVSVVVGSETGAVEVYLLGDIPHELSDLDKLTPVGSIANIGIAHEAGVDFAPQNAQYVALRWALSANRLQPLAVAEVSVFALDASRQGIATLAAAEQPPTEPVPDPPIIAGISP